MGALTYHPPARVEADAGGALDLEALARQSQALLSGKSSEVLPQLLRAGGSPGGARPKILVGFNAAGDELLSGTDDVAEGFEHWMIKFPAREPAGRC
jgi:serine/threonine-protein kinase HipA